MKLLFDRQLTGFEQIRITNVYLMGRGGSTPFLKQMVVSSANSAMDEATALPAVIALIRNFNSKAMTVHRPEEKEELLKTIRLVMPVLCRALTSKLQQFDLSKSKAIPDLLSKFLQFQVGNRVVYDLLAVEFARYLDTYSLRDKCVILDALATADIDATGAIRTAHTVCASVFEAFRLQLIDQSLQDPLGNVEQYVEQL